MLCIKWPHNLASFSSIMFIGISFAKSYYYVVIFTEPSVAPTYLQVTAHERQALRIQWMVRIMSLVISAIYFYIKTSRI